MGFFNRRPRDAPAPGPATTTNGHHRAARHHNEPYSMATRPTFGQWLRHTWLDILTMAAMGAVGLGVSLTQLTGPDPESLANENQKRSTWPTLHRLARLQ